MKRPLMAEEFCIPQNRAIETPLFAGATLFGVGWGLSASVPGRDRGRSCSAIGRPGCSSQR